jgi:hypothetical protein
METNIVIDDIETIIDQMVDIYFYVDTHFEAVKYNLLNHLFGGDCILRSYHHNEMRIMDETFPDRIKKLSGIVKKLLYDVTDINMIIDLINIDPHYILCFNPENLSEDIYIKALELNGQLLMYFPNQTEKMCLTAVKRNSNAFKYVKEQTYDICEMAIKLNPYHIEKVKKELIDQTLCEKAVKLNGNVLSCIDEQYHNYDLYNLAIETESLSISKMIINDTIINKNQYNELCEKVIKKDPIALRFIKKEYHNYDLYNLAITINPSSIQYMCDPSIDLCMRAIKSDPSLLKHISPYTQTIELCLKAIKLDPNTCKYVCKKYKKQCQQELSGVSKVSQSLKNYEDEDEDEDEDEEDEEDGEDNDDYDQ